MTVVPLPASPCIRVRMIYNTVAAADAGNRLYFSYSGSAPTAANCVTLASDIESAWATNLKPLISNDYALVEVDVLDIATDSGAFGTWTGDVVGTRTGTPPPVQCAMNVEFNIARRYRGGKPRCFLPAGIESDLLAPNTWTESFLSAVETGFSGFITAVEALSVGAVGTLQHVNLSYYKGFTNITNSSGRERAVPTYRATALVDSITGYAVKQIIGSQKRRRTSSTP